MREWQESQGCSGFLASTAGWVVVSGTEMEKLVWEKIKSQKCMKKEERESCQRNLDSLVQGMKKKRAKHLKLQIFLRKTKGEKKNK